MITFSSSSFFFWPKPFSLDASKFQKDLESLALGVPCLTSYNNEYLRHDEELLNLLTVEQYENPWQIKKGIERVLSYNPVILKKRLVNYSSIITKEADLLLESFLNNASNTKN